MRMRHIFICDMSSTTIFFSTLSHKKARFSKKKKSEHKMCVLIFLYSICLIHLSLYEDLGGIWSQMYIYRSSCKVPVILSSFSWKFNFLEFFEKYLNIKFHENLLRGSEFFPCGRTDRQTNMTMLIVAFRSFPNAPKNNENTCKCFVPWPLTSNRRVSVTTSW